MDKKPIRQAVSAKDAFGKIKACRAGRYAEILKVMQDGAEYTGQQLCQMTKMTPNLISARLNEMRERDLVEQSDVRVVCPVTGAKVFTHKKKPRQLGLPV